MSAVSPLRSSGPTSVVYAKADAKMDAAISKSLLRATALAVAIRPCSSRWRSMLVFRSEAGIQQPHVGVDEKWYDGRLQTK